MNREAHTETETQNLPARPAKPLIDTGLRHLPPREAAQSSLTRLAISGWDEV